MVDIVAAMTAATRIGPITTSAGNSSINLPTINKVVLSDSLLPRPGKIEIAVIPNSTKKNVVNNGMNAMTWKERRKVISSFAA